MCAVRTAQIRIIELQGRTNRVRPFVRARM